MMLRICQFLIILGVSCLSRTTNGVSVGSVDADRFGRPLFDAEHCSVVRDGIVAFGILN